MDGYRRLLTLLVPVGLFCLSGAQCPCMFRRPELAMPHVLPPAPTLEQVAQVVNGNSLQIQSLLATGATLSGSGFPMLRTNLAFQRPKRFRLQAELLTSAELDVGSNDDLYWFWVKRSEPPAVYYCRREQFALSPARQMIPIEPDWLIEAMGVVEFDPALPHEGPIVLPDGRLEIRTYRETPAGPVIKSTIVHAESGWVLEQRFYDAANRLVARAVASRHQRDPLSSAGPILGADRPGESGGQSPLGRSGRTLGAADVSGGSAGRRRRPAPTAAHLDDASDGGRNATASSRARVAEADVLTSRSVDRMRRVRGASLCSLVHCAGKKSVGWALPTNRSSCSRSRLVGSAHPTFTLAVPEGAFSTNPSAAMLTHRVKFRTSVPLTSG